MKQRKRQALIIACAFLLGMLLGTFGAISLKGSGLINFINTNSATTTAAFTFVLAISTIGLWIATHDLWTTAEKQITVAENAATAAQNSAVVASDSLGLARQIANHQLRAYITTAKYCILDYKLEAKASLTAAITIRNRGQTPAHEVTYTLTSALVPVSESDTTLIVFNPCAGFTMAPGDRSVLTADSVDLDEEAVAAIKAGTQTILVLCQLDYRDAFGAAHRTRMRASLNTNNPVDPTGRIELEWHGTDNDMT